jgi:ribosomal protein L10
LTPSKEPNIDTPPSLTILRTSVFGAALRDYAPLDAKTSKEIANTVKGGLAVLSLPTLDPPQLNAILRALQRSAPLPPSNTSASQASPIKKASDDPDFVPGRRSKRVKPILTPELSVMGALIEGRVFKAPQVLDVASLPTLDILRQQIVGLLSSPATQLAAVLSHASGGQLARTLEGFKKGLEEDNKTDLENSS